MPQFCSLFYAILQSWRPKGGGGGHGPMAPPKYAPEKAHSMSWASMTTSQQHILAAFPDIYMSLKESNVDSCHIAFSKKKKIYEVQT